MNSSTYFNFFDDVNKDYTKMEVSAFNDLLEVKGLPKEKIIDIYGNENSGKTAFILHMIADLQRRDNFIAYIDCDNKLNIDYMDKEGIDSQTLLVYKDNIGEHIIDFIKDVLNKKIFTLLVIDSLPAIISEKELNNSMTEYNNQEIINQVIKITSELIQGSNCTVVFISQLRCNAEKQEIEFGKKSLSTYTSATIKFNLQEDLYQNSKKIGERIHLYSEKNKLGKPFNNTYFDILY